MFVDHTDPRGLTVVREEVPPPPEMTLDISKQNYEMHRLMAMVRRNMAADDYKRAPELVVGSEHMAGWVYQWVRRNAPDLQAIVIVVEDAVPAHVVAMRGHAPPEPGYAKTPGFMDGERQYVDHVPLRALKERDDSDGLVPTQTRDRGVGAAPDGDDDDDADAPRRGSAGA